MTGLDPVLVNDLVVGNNYIVDSRTPNNISNKTYLATCVKKLSGILVFRNVTNKKLTFSRSRMDRHKTTHILITDN
jgi:hypothetical protein